MWLIGWFPFKLIVLKYLLNIHSEEAEGQVGRTQVLPAALSNSALASEKTLRRQLRAQSLLLQETHPQRSFLLSISFCHMEFSPWEEFWGTEFSPSGCISSPDCPCLHPALKRGGLVSLGVKWGLHIKRSHACSQQGNSTAHISPVELPIICESMFLHRKRSTEVGAGLPRAPGSVGRQQRRSPSPASSTPAVGFALDRVKASRKDQETTYLSKWLIELSCYEV